MITPLETYPKLAEKLGVFTLYFKREDLHPYGSHKGRSIPSMIDYYYEKGDRSFAISGSGNAALAAALHVNLINSKPATEPITLDIFVGNHIANNKLDKLEKLVISNKNSIRILKKERPLQALLQSSQEGCRSLRQSTDDVALLGYESLANELEESNKIDKIGAVFLGTSSGTTAQALAIYFSEKNFPIQIHIVQTSSCHPLSAEFEHYDGPNEPSIADAIVDQTAQRKSKLIPILNQTGGRGWIASNEDITSAQELVYSATGLNISTNSALSVVGVMKASYTGIEIAGSIVCLICGD